MNYVYRKCGLSHIPNPLLNTEIEKIILEESLITFSTYYPYFGKITVDEVVDAVPHQKGFFYLKPAVPELTIIGVSEMYRNNSNNGLRLQEYADYAFVTSPYDLEALQANQNVASMGNFPSTFLFHPPNIIEVFPKSSHSSNRTILFVTRFVHPSHLMTIPLSLIEQWKKLVEYDVKISLYEILKHYESTETPFGTIDLKIDSWSSAEDSRTSLLETWENNYAKEPNRKKIYFA